MVEYPGDRDRESPSLLEQRLRAEIACLQKQVEEAERETALTLASLDCQNAGGYVVPEQMRCEGEVRCARHQRDGHKELAKVRGEALERVKMGRMDIGGKDEAMPRAVMMSEAADAIAMTLEEALSSLGESN